jgi:single-stranded DNA-specific DHH superfamily exonuclease
MFSGIFLHLALRMNYYDVFNGDADGICALIQLRLAAPRASILITGVKRDVALAGRVPAEVPAAITILDISLDKNRTAVDKLLSAGSSIFYVDHHFPGDDLPDATDFKALIDTQPTTCTSLLVDQHLEGRFHNWAIAAAFGDNLNEVAEELAINAGLSPEETEALKTLGICINYNGYGSNVEDLHFHPANLYREFVEFSDPIELIASNPMTWQKLRDGYKEDMAQGLASPILKESASSLVVKLPDEAWARRVSGVLGNELANRNPDKACAIVTETADTGYQVSIRAPLTNRCGADELARQFPTGGGRKAAAGINALPGEQLEAFLDSMARFWALAESGAR